MKVAVSSGGSSASNAAGSAWYTKAAIQRARLAMTLAGADTQQGSGALQQGGLPIQQGVASMQQVGVPFHHGGVTVQQECGVTPVQQGGCPIQHGGRRRRLFAEYDPAVMRMAKAPRLSTITIPQVGSWHALLLGLPKRLYTG